MTNLPAGQPLALKPYEALDLEIQQAARRTATSFIEFAQLALRAIREQIWANLGFASEREYFDSRGLPYRSLRRWLVIATGLERLPDAEAPQVKQALAELGSHKAESISRLIGSEHDWRGLLSEARDLSAEAVQSRVADLTGALPRGRQSEPGEKFLAMLCQAMPPTLMDGTQITVGEWVEGCFRAGMQHLEMTNPIAFFLLAIGTMNNELGAQGFDPKGAT